MKGLTQNHTMVFSLSLGVNFYGAKAMKPAGGLTGQDISIVAKSCDTGV